MLNRRLTMCLMAGGVMLAAHLPGTTQDGGKAAGDTNLSPVIPPQIILAPTEVRADPTLARGCWVRLFPETGYKGSDDLTIAGPVSIPSLHAPTGGASGVYWKPKAESLIVGPKASLIVYENQAFRGRSVTVPAGTKEPQLRNRMKFAQSIDSLKIACNK